MTGRRTALLLGLLVLGGAPPSGACANDERCGGNAGSFAEVVESSRGRGPVVSRPSSLCADVESRAPVSVDVQVVAPLPGDSQGEGERRGMRRR